jgi:hypothetical protein
VFTPFKEVRGKNNNQIIIQAYQLKKEKKIEKGE